MLGRAGELAACLRECGHKNNTLTRAWPLFCRYNLLRHVGEVSSFQGRRPPAGGFPACSDPLSGPSELLLEHERYNAACAGASDLSPCDASPPASGDGDGVAHLCAGHPAGCRRRQDV